MKRLLAFLCLALLAGSGVMSAKRTLTVYVPLIDALTGNAFNQEMYRPTFDICTATDSAIVAKSQVSVGNECMGSISSDDDSARFLIHAYVDGIADDGGTFPDDTYEDAWLPLDLSSVKGSIKRFQPVTLGRRKAKRLDEVTVTASKIMFYHKGDTLVYNADAFVLSSGSMLDALLEQLPGVTLNSNGVVYCNGRKVDNLLLNGKDFFNGDKKLMLSNLAAYTVKDIAVYDKRGHLSEMFAADMGDYSHVMDVRLKREYRNGYLASAEGGYGTHDRYLGRLFGMWFSDFVSLSVNAGANNLSDSSVPGKDDGAWSADKMGQGVSERQYGGITYFASGQRSKWEIRGGVQITNNTDHRSLSVATESYLAQNTQFEYSRKNETNRFLDLKTDHSLYLPLSKRIDLSVRPTFSYREIDMDNDMVDVTLNDSLKDVSTDLLNAIYDDASAYADVVNRYRDDSKRTGRTLDGNLDLYSNIRLSAIGETPMALTLRGHAKFFDNREDIFNRYIIKTGQEISPSYNANRYFRNYPTHNETYLASADFSRHMNPGIIHLIYEYSRYDEIKTSEAFMLHQIPGYTDFGTLPSVSEYMPTFLPEDSYRSDIDNNTHKITASYRAQHRIGGRFFNITAAVPLFIYARRLHYVGRGVDCIRRQTDILPDASLSLKYHAGDSKSFQWSVEPKVRFNQRPVNMMYLIEATNNTDPLNVYLGNPDLKNFSELSSSLTFSASKRQIKHQIDASFTKQYNSLGQSYTFNADSGVRTYRMQNVNGNYSLSGHYFFFTTFGPMSRFHITNRTSAGYSRSVDFSGVRIINRGPDGNPPSGSATAPPTLSPPLRSVYTNALTEELKLDWLIGKQRISAHVNTRYDKYTSTDRFFTTLDTWTCTAGASAIINLPYGWGLSTDFNMFMRRGYADSRLNTTDLIWNARVTKSILSGSVMFILDAYDLLRQLSNISYTVNAQARTETVTNVIPSYLLLHLRWNFNKQPKRN
ncbi:MAG: outer membrane beta-barrel family protein [Muribaculaceae bacterium]|nr:outer membrane beta-barrel family protein [Muribaculaceae bacterium]